MSRFKVSSGNASTAITNKRTEGTDTELPVPVRWPQHCHFVVFFPTGLYSIDLALHKDNMDNSTSTGKSGHRRTNTLRTVIRVDSIVTMVL